MYPTSDFTSSEKIHWATEIEQRVPRLTHSLDGRWPLVLWRIIPTDEISPEVAEMLLERGLVAALPLDRSSIGTAKALESVGAPVVLTAGSGAGTSWPYHLEKDESLWAYKFKPTETARAKVPIPTRFAGWSIAASETKSILRSFQDAGITVDAAWLDYESLPFQARYRDAVNSLNGPEYLPEESIRNPGAYHRYTRQLWISLLSTYIAAPFREIFPKISVTNWLAVLSLPEFPVPSWYGHALPMVGPTLFTATNPVAYGIDTAFNAKTKPNALWTQRDVDRVYTEILLRQISADSYARGKIAPYVDSVAWIARWVRDDPRTLTPMMSRSAYREALRHLWLRGVDAMEIFSPTQNLATKEIEDASVALDEMLAVKDFLTLGKVLNYDYVISNRGLTLWSGMEHGDQAIVRATSFSGKTETIAFTFRGNNAITLPAPVNGATYLLRNDHQRGMIDVERLD